VPEIPNPSLQSRNSGGGGERFVLILTILAFVFLFSHRYFVHPEPAALMQSSQPAGSRAAELRTSTPVAVVNGKSSGPSREAPDQFGWLTFIAKPLYLALRFVREHGVSNWGWAIIVLTVIFNLLMFWPRMMSMRSSLKMMRVQPKVDALKKRYAHLKMNDPERAEMNKELMELYKAEGANMYGGCLPMILQMPLFLAYVRVLQNAVELHQAHWFWLADLSSPDPLHILPVFIILTMFLTQFITPSPGMDPTQRRLLAFVMPVIMGFTLWRYASGLALYWATGNVMNLVIQLAVNRTRMGREMHAVAAGRADANRL
jgi:YidC/Oxa1 family membrane protein insertase